MRSAAIAFRVDASIQIGTGHVMRCLTLADVVRERGADCCFVCRAHKGNLINFIEERGYKVVELPLPEVSVAALENSPEPAHAQWLGVNWQTDALQTMDAIEPAHLDLLMVDHYALDARWEQKMRPLSARTMVIDDLADRVHDCDLLLDQNLGRSEQDYASICPARCKRMIGPRFALLRPEFPDIRGYSLARTEGNELKQLLVTMGGVDKLDATTRVLEALRSCALPQDLKIIVVMGPHAPWVENVRSQAKLMPWSTEVLAGTSDMARLMADSDLAVGAAGSTSWERCCLGLPSVQVVLADNQREIARALEHAGAAVTVDLDSLPTGLVRVFESGQLTGDNLAVMSQVASSITDGTGATLVADELQWEIQ